MSSGQTPRRRSTTAEFFELVGRAMSAVPGEITRGMNRFSSSVLTRNNLFKDVRTLSDLPVNGDTIAWVTRGDRLGSNN